MNYYYTFLFLLILSSDLNCISLIVLIALKYHLNLVCGVVASESICVLQNSFFNNVIMLWIVIFLFFIKSMSSSYISTLLIYNGMSVVIYLLRCVYIFTDYMVTMIINLRNLFEITICSYFVYNEHVKWFMQNSCKGDKISNK